MIRKQESLGFIASLVLGVLFVVLFYDGEFGISYVIFTFAMLSFYGLFTKRRGCGKVYFYVGSVYIFLLSSVYVRCDFVLFKLLNFLIIPTLLFVHLAISTGAKEGKDIIRDAFAHLFMPIGKMACFFLFITRQKSMDKKRREKVIKVMIGIIIVIPILLVIMPLMFKADAVFAHKIISSTEGVSGLFKSRFIGQISIAIVVASYLYGQLCYTQQDKIKGETMNLQMDEQGEMVVYQGFDRTMTATCMIVLDVLYVFFSGIQVIYLFGGATLPEGYSYAKYAREGFFQLLLLSMINGLIILSINQFYSRYRDKKPVGEQERDTLISGLLTVMVICTFIMIISSLYRMHLYDVAYGFTRMRLLVWMFLIMELVTLGVVAYGIWNRKMPLGKVLIVIALSGYLLVNFVNIDSVVACRNIDRYMQIGEIDALYLEELSADALKQMMRLREVEPDMYNRYVEHLHVDETSWQGFNLSVYRGRLSH